MGHQTESAPRATEKPYSEPGLRRIRRIGSRAVGRPSRKYGEDDSSDGAQAKSGQESESTERGAVVGGGGTRQREVF